MFRPAQDFPSRNVFIIVAFVHVLTPVCFQVIPFIASDFKKDKIWLRRSQPSKRAYQV